jgi:hypothetical protein
MAQIAIPIPPMAKTEAVFKSILSEELAKTEEVFNSI